MNTPAPRSRFLVLPLIVLGLLLFASSAIAAAPIDLGEANGGPRLAVSETGAGYLTWASDQVLHYCRVDPGATSCSESKTFGDPLPGYDVDEGSAPLVTPNRVLIVSDRFKSNNAKFVYSSTGVFTVATQVANESNTDMSDAIFAPGGTIAGSERILTVESGAAETFGGRLQATSSGGESTSASFSLSNGEGTRAEAIARVGSTAYAAYIDLDSGVIFMRSYSGDGSLAHLNNSSSWTAPAAVAQGDTNVVLAGGPSGLYIAYDRPSDEAVVLQKFTGSGWSSPIVLSTPAVVNGWFGLSEDPAGVLHFSWEDGENLLYRYGRDTSNTSFTNPQTLAGGGDFAEQRLETNAAGNGWISWENFNDEHAEVMPIAPGEPPAPAPGPGPKPTPPAAGGPATPTYKGPTKNTEKSIGHGLGASLNTPKGCVAGGSLFKAKVAVKRTGSKAHKSSYTVPKVKFYLGKKLISTDKKKPFEVSLATAGLGTGKTLEVAAKISVNLHLGHRHSTVGKTLKANVTTCK
jgi:hypothetical protein